MRVITGNSRGRKLAQPRDMDIRPTAEAVKEALFNIIQFDIEGRRVLDLFAGTGQLGIEALSRGAAGATFVDGSKEAVDIVTENLKRCNMKAPVVRADALEFLTRGEKFDVIFLDPPYKTGLVDKALEKIIEFDILADGGIIICEMEWDEQLNPIKEPYFVEKEYKYGKIKLVRCSKQ